MTSQMSILGLGGLYNGSRVAELKLWKILKEVGPLQLGK